MEEFEKWRARVDELVGRAEEKIREIGQRVEALAEGLAGAKGVDELMSALGELVKARAEAREELRRFRLSARGLIREARGELSRTLSPEAVEEVVDELREYVDERVGVLKSEFEVLSDRIGELRKRVKRLVKAARGGGEVRIGLPEIVLPDIGRVVEEALSLAVPKSRSIVVSSIRLPRADLEVIDALVEAGVFRSRNEGIAFFVHRGIVCSREWLERVRSKIEEIRRLREETRRELEDMMGGEKEGSGSVKVDVE